MTKQQFTVVNSSSNLDATAPIGTRVLISHDATNKFDKHALRAKLNAVAQGTEVNSVLFEIMKQAGEMEGFPCIVVEHQVVMIGNAKQLKRTCLVVEPVNVIQSNADDEKKAGVKFE